MTTPLHVYQDGADFYAEPCVGLPEGGYLWSAPSGTVRHDYDTRGATEARDLFLAHARVQGLNVTFEAPAP